MNFSSHPHRKLYKEYAVMHKNVPTDEIWTLFYEQAVYKKRCKNSENSYLCLMIFLTNEMQALQHQWKTCVDHKED